MRRGGLGRRPRVWLWRTAITAIAVWCAVGWTVAQSPGSPAPTGELSAKDLYEEAKFREQQFELDRAAELYREVIEKHPTSDWAKLAEERLTVVAEQQQVMQSPAAPGATLGRILLSLFGSCFSLMFLLSWLLFFAYRGGWLWQSTIGARIGDPISGLVERFRGRKKLSREFEARKLNPRDARSRHGLGVLYYQSRRYDKALAELAESVAIDPDRTDAQYFLGLTLLKLNRPAEAVGPFEKVVAAKPRHGGDAMVRLAEAKLAVGEAEEAERLCREAMKGAPSDADCRYHLALALDAQGKHEEAPALLEEAIRVGRAYRGARRREVLTAVRKAKAYVRSRKARPA